jgi:subtilisin family serine protease
MRKIFFGSALALLCIACKRNSETNSVEQVDETLQTRETINAFIQNTLQEKHVFNWSIASDIMIWSAGQQSDNIYAVGFKPEYESIDIQHKIDAIDIKSNAWSNAKKQLIDVIVASERNTKANITATELLAFEENTLPLINVHIENLNTIKLLRASKLVRYVEPMGYEPSKHEINTARSSSGCDGVPADNSLTTNDYTTIMPGAKQSWNYAYHGIAQTWDKGLTGQGVKIFIIDTGVDPDQDNLGIAFNQGASSGRTIEKIVTLPRNTFLGIPTGSVETPADACGHGTSMTGVAVAPRGTDGNAVGVAYNSSVVVCRAAEDVYLDASREVKGVADAYVNAANRTDVKIISMSMGRLTSTSQITDAINYAYNKGKLMFCAGGTSLSFTAGWAGVIFPASLSKVNAVTGVRDNITKQCDICHDGDEIDFTVVMEKGSNDRHPLTVSTDNTNQPGTVGGSSVATATAAGIAALVWSKNLIMSRDQILNILVTTSKNYPNKNSSFGWGNINADAATN